MAKATKVKQLSVSIPNKVGLLAEVTGVLAKAKVNIITICAYEMDESAYFMLVTDSNAKAKKALAKIGAAIVEEDVLCVELSNKVGELHKVGKILADGEINIYYLYGTTGTGKASNCIFSTSDNKKALKLLNK